MTASRYKLRHPEQQEDEIYLGNVHKDQLIHLDKWRTRRLGQQAMISPNFTATKQWEPLNIPDYHPQFIAISEVEAAIRDARSADEAADYRGMLDARWDGCCVQGVEQ